MIKTVTGALLYVVLCLFIMAVTIGALIMFSKHARGAEPRPVLQLFDYTGNYAGRLAEPRKPFDRAITYPESYVPVLIPATEVEALKKQLGPRLLPLVPAWNEQTIKSRG